jgi:hypothetical protein
MSVGVVSTSFPTAKYFQPHNIAQIGTPLGNPTEKTYQNFHPYDYPNVALVTTNLYAGLGTNASQYSQTYSLSCHMEYMLRNQSNVPVKYEMIRWTVKKEIPRPWLSITEPVDPLSITAPVYTGNILNFLGYCMVTNNVAPAVTNPDATNAYLTNAEVTLKELPLWNEYVDYKIIKFTLGISKSRNFKVGKRMLEINTQNIFNNAANVVDTTPQTWVHSFVPGATGLLFRQFGSLETITGVVSDLNAIGYSQPESILATKTTYTAYAWKNNPEIQGHVFLTDVGITSTTNANLRFVDRNANIHAVANAI